MGQQHAAVARYVVELELPGHLRDQPDIPLEIDGVEAARIPRLARAGEPDLLAVRTPTRRTAGQVEAARKLLGFPTRAGDDHDGPRLVALEECDRVPVRGKPQPSDQRTFVEHFSDRKLDAVPRIDVPDDREL